jgi:hypothetical protein
MSHQPFREALNRHDLSNPDHGNFIYVISAEITVPVKIGISANPLKRLRDLQCASPERLELVATFPGSHYVERNVHDFLAPARLQGEWFELTPSQIERFRDRGYSVETLAEQISWSLPSSGA